MKTPFPIETAPLFPELDALLLSLLRELSPSDWEKPTLAPKWRVKDIAAHLLDGNLRVLAMLRDGYFGETPPEIRSYQDLVTFLDGLNADWVKAHRRLSPRQLIQWLESSGKEYSQLMAELPPQAPALFAVAWAGESESQNWFHVAREYTEKWHHQQQIRYAVGKTQPLYAEHLYLPFLETTLRALPFRYRAIEAAEGSTLAITISPFATHWLLEKGKETWTLRQGQRATADCQLSLPGEIAWRIFTKGISAAEALEKAHIQGQKALAEPLFTTLAIMG